MTTPTSVPTGSKRATRTTRPEYLNLCAAQARLVGSCLIWLSALVMITPFLLHGPSCGADFIFHYTSWHDAANSWRHGVLYPHWASSANFRAGEPRFVFYPPAVWMLGAALGIVLPWHLAPIALCLLLLAGAGLATRALARQVLPESAAGLAGCTAVFSGYSICEIYHHSDFALLAGGLWIPLLLLLFFRQERSAGPDLLGSIFNTRTVLLALALTGTWLSNTPLGLMATYLLVVMGIGSALRSRSWRPLARVAVALALGLGLAGFYLVPAMVEQHWVDIQKLFAAPDHLVQNRWLTSELHSAHERKRGLIEILMLAMALGGLAVTRVRGRWPAEGQLHARRQWLLLAVIPVAVFYLMFPVSFPIWNIVPRLRYLQYPWRWLVVLQAPMAIFFAAAVCSVRVSLRRYAFIACGLLFVAATFGASRSKSMFRAGSAASSGPYSLAAMDRALDSTGAGVGGAEEYASQPGAANELIPAGLPDACLVRDPATTLSSIPATTPVAFYTPRAWSAALKTCEATFGAAAGSRPEHLHLTARIDTPGYLVLRLRSFPAWKITVNGKLVRDLPARPDGLIAVPVPQGPVELSVNWMDTPDVLLGRLLTAIAALLAAAVLWFGWSRRAPLETAAEPTYEADLVLT